jgi:hypothetical protein
MVRCSMKLSNAGNAIPSSTAATASATISSIMLNPERNRLLESLLNKLLSADNRGSREFRQGCREENG